MKEKNYKNVILVIMLFKNFYINVIYYILRVICLVVIVIGGKLDIRICLDGKEMGLFFRFFLYGINLCYKY